MTTLTTPWVPGPGYAKIIELMQQEEAGRITPATEPIPDTPAADTTDTNDTNDDTKDIPR